LKSTVVREANANKKLKEQRFSGVERGKRERNPTLSGGVRIKKRFKCPCT